VLTEVDLEALGVSLDEAKGLTTALKVSRAQKPDREDRPTGVKDSPFAALASLNQPVTPARRKRRPRRSAK